MRYEYVSGVYTTWGVRRAIRCHQRTPRADPEAELTVVDPCSPDPLAPAVPVDPGVGRSGPEAAEPVGGLDPELHAPWLPAAAACSRLPTGEGLRKGLVDILRSAFVQIADETGLVLRLLQG